MKRNKNCKVTISQSALRIYKGKLALTTHQLCELLGEQDIFNDINIVRKHLGSKGLNMNPYKNAKLALNFKA